jgi:hypothetical protein
MTLKTAAALWLLVAGATGVAAVPFGPRARGARTISVFGSSVADGAFCSGNCSGRALASVPPASAAQGGCYQSRLRVHQGVAAGQGRDVFNNCHGGDSTTKLLDRYHQLLAARPHYCLIGLSLANEGIIEGGQPIYDKYAAGMAKLMQQNAAHGIHTVVGSNYANSNYNATQYRFIKDINILSQTWGVPSANFLGAIDDGKGQWVLGFVASAGHPNDEGQTEMYHSIVPSVWDAIDAGRLPLPAKRAAPPAPEPARRAAVVYRVPADEPVHSYSYGFRFKTDPLSERLHEGPSPLFTVTASDEEGSVYNLTLSLVPPHEQAPGFRRRRLQSGLQAYYHVPAALAYESPIGGGVSDHGIRVPLNATDGGAGRSLDDGEWHEVVLAHFWANRSTNLYVDGRAVGQLAAERATPSSFALAAVTAANVAAGQMTADLRIWRSALNADEVAYLFAGNTYQSSLEVWSPLGGPPNAAPANLAQSMTKLSLV